MFVGKTPVLIKGLNIL